MKSTDLPIETVEVFSESKEKVWNALTELQQMQQWYFEQIESFIPEIGFETQFVVSNEGRTFTHEWKIVEVIPYEKLKYNWQYKEYEGESFLTFLLSEENGKVKLNVIAETVSDFSDNVPEFKRESCINGWQYFINQRLKNYIENLR